MGKRSERYHRIKEAKIRVQLAEDELEFLTDVEQSDDFDQSDSCLMADAQDDADEELRRAQSALARERKR